MRFHRRKGYGFIDRGQGAELFVHVSELAPTAGPRALRPGQRVRFDVAAGPRGPQAVNVRPVPAGRSS
ncbi:MAG TPA: cold shock domain-containing protein [Acidimicrobiales bacterium]